MLEEGDIPQFIINPRLLTAATLLWTAGTAFAGAPPIVDQFTAVPSVVQPGGLIELAIEAHDPDCPDTCTSGCGQYIRSDLTQWTATGGTFTAIDNRVPISPYSAAATWQAPAAEGTYTITVNVSDSGTFMCGGRLTTSVSLDVFVDLNPNLAPIVEAVTADPTRLFPGGTSELTCTASDPDGDPVDLTWATDSGTVVPGGATGSATFTAGDVGIASVTCTATDPAGAHGSQSISLAVVGASAERSIQSVVVTPRRMAIDPIGTVYVVDRGAGGISVVDLEAGTLIYRLQIPDVTALAVDWNNNLLVGGLQSAGIIDRHGNHLIQLEENRGEISDVAVDINNRHYAILHRTSGQVTVYAETGVRVTSFGSTGDGDDQFRGPLGLAVTGDGNWVVGDTGHGLIKVFSASGSFLGAFGGLGGNIGEFVRLDDVEVDAAGVIFASDSYQSWVQTFNPDGSVREVLGTYGDEPGNFKTPTGIAAVDDYDRLIVASLNSPSLEVFRTTDEPVTFPLPAQGSVTPASLVFPPQEVGTSSAPQTVMLMNTGERPLGIAQVSTTGDFHQSNACGPFVGPGESCEINITFRPVVVGSAVGSITVDTSSSGEPMIIEVSGSGYEPAPILTLSPSSLVFGAQEVGTVSPPQHVTLTNSGSAPLVITSIEASPEYLQTNDCPTSLPNGATCTVSVTFAPSMVGDHIIGTLMIVSNASASPHIVDLDGQGTPVVPWLTIDDQVVTETNGKDGQAVFTVSLSSQTTETVTVDFATVSDTATAGEDYIATSGTLVFESGATEMTIAVAIIGDSLLEPDEETFDLELSSPSNAELSDNLGTGTILDDEPCLGPELVINGSAEKRPDESGIPGWNKVDSSPWQPRGAPPIPVHGDAYFYPGTDKDTELMQDIDVSALAATIDAGSQVFVFNAWIRSLYETADTARVIIEYRDWANQSVLDAFDTGLLSSPIGWTEVFDERLAPTGTTWIRVRLISNSPGESYFDAISLRTLRALTVVIGDAAGYEGDSGSVTLPFSVRLACPFSQEVTVDFNTADGSAVAGQDYAPASGSVALPPGQTAAEIPVEIFGDTWDEAHEDFSVGLEGALPVDALILDPTAKGVIYNDDFCPKRPSCWFDHPEKWLVDWLVVGGVEYDKEELLRLLSGFSPNHTTTLTLAGELVATKLNLTAGSAPDIMPTVIDADDLLTEFPPGTVLDQPFERIARGLIKKLRDYNAQPCRADSGCWP